jgi:8-oxo-dGTP diphosphatase
MCIYYTIKMYDINRNYFHLTADAVVFTIMNDSLKILLIKRKYDPYKGMFALPGGYINIDEELEDGVKRELEEETGVKNVFLKQLHAYGKIGRDPRGRIVTIPYLALIDSEDIKLHATTDAEDAKWYEVYDMPKLAFDHKQIIDEALSLLRYDIEHSNIAYQIMPEKFTMTELKSAYEIVLGVELDKRNFYKKIKELNILKELHETKMDGPHRPAKLFSFKSKELKYYN